MPANPERSYPSRVSAEAAARQMGCSGSHQANGGWMPCATARDLAVILGTTDRGQVPAKDGEREVGIRGIQTASDGGLTSASQNGPFGGAAAASGKQLSSTSDRMVMDKGTAVDLVKTMRGVLADVITFYLRAHGYHWNVEGADFSQYHILFENIYSDVYESIDPLAEIIRKLDAYAPFTLSGLVALRSLDDTKVSPAPLEMAKDLLDANDKVTKVLMNAFDVANKDNQQGVANFLAERIDAHQKWSWFLRSSLK